MTVQERIARNELKDFTRQANNRLRLLERKGLAGESKAYGYVKRKAYDGDGAVYSNTGKPKFRTDIKNMSYEEVKQQLESVRTFLQAKSSTPTRIRKSHEEAYKKYKANYDNNITFEKYMEMWTEAGLRWYNSTFGSQQLRLLIEKYEDEANQRALHLKEYLDEKGITELDITVMERDTILENMKKER